MATGVRPSPPRGPQDRLPRANVVVNRGREVRLGLLGVTALLVLVVGIPVALVLFVGYPLPRTAPTQAWLTQTVTATLIINILACVVWLVWAHFTVCLLTEWRAVRRGRLPAQVALGGGSQLLARRLVATALLLAGAATAIPHGSTGASAPAAPRTTISAPAAANTAERFLQPTQAPAAVHHAAQAHHPAAAHAAAAPADHATEAVHKYYVVQPPHGRRYDSLWDIAERTLKDPLRYKEIFALNKDRVQADGRKLVDANLIQPGWELKLPADASGPGVHVVHASAPVKKAAPAEAAAHATTTHHPATAHHPAHPATSLQHTASLQQPIIATHLAPAPPAVRDQVAAPSTTATTTSSSSTSSGSLPLGGALMLAGLLVALSAKRGPYGTPTEDESALGLAADPGLAALLDRALRNLAAARTAQHRALPQPVVAWVSQDRVTLNLAGGDETDPPAPWHLGDDARSWTSDLVEAAADRTADVAAPFPGLLSVGRHDEYELFVDFEQAPGLISLTGDVEQARQLAAALAVQAVTSLWSDGARATLVGFGDGAELASIDPRAITQVSHLGDVLDDLVHEHESLLRLQHELGVDGVLTGRQSRRSRQWRPRIIVLSGPPTPDEAARLQQLAAGRSNVVVLMVGESAAARWRFVLDAAGRLDLGVLGATAQAHRLDRDAVRRLVELVERAEREGRDASRAAADMTPHRALSSTGPAAAAPAVEPHLEDRHASEPTVSVALLGPVHVSAPGPVDAAKRDLLTEIVVAVALHPEGLHDAVLRASIWPRGVSDQVCAAAMADAAAWLGHDERGRSCVALSDGRWRLSGSVRTDWDELRRLAESAAGPGERDALMVAANLFTGEAFSQTPPGRYGWLAFARAAREARLVGTAVARRAATLLLEQGRPEHAEEVLRRGLILVPTAELLWRELLAVTARRGPDGPAAAGAVADEMYATLAGHRAWPEPETDALVAHLAPDRSVGRTG